MSGANDPEMPDYTPAEIQQAVAAIPRFAREVFLMHRADGLAYGEIARQLGISERRVIRLMTKALTAIRRARQDRATATMIDDRARPSQRLARAVQSNASC